jgi:PAS domain S-box-containing protein
LAPRPTRAPARDPRANAFAHLFGAVREGVFIGLLTIADDDAAGATLAANAYLKTIFGYTADAPDADVAPFAPDRFADPLARASFLDRLTSEGAVNDYLLRMRRVDGSPVWVEVTARAEPAPKRTVRVEALIRDVSERKRLDDQSRDLYQQLLQAEKMAALGQTISGVAHELNNPLAVVIGQAFLLSQQAGPGPLAQRTEKLARAAERCSRIVKNFLALARQYPPERSEVALNQLARDAVDLLAYPLRVDSVTVELDLAEGVPSLWADRHQLSQVLVNLVANAHQAMRAVPASRRRLTISTRAWPDRSGVRLAVADTGPGVPPEIERRIFEPFFTTKAPGEGTGLGLSLCQGIVESHGGRIGVESDRGAGARFWVDLSVGREPAAPPKAEPATPPIASQRILVVDDEPEVGELIREILSTDGHLVDVCSDGRAALARLDGQQYDMILSDIRMPQLDGPGLYLELEQRRDPVLSRFVFVTGDVLDARTRDLIARARVASLHKPFTAAGLREVIRRVRARGA